MAVVLERLEEHVLEEAEGVARKRKGRKQVLAPLNGIEGGGEESEEMPALEAMVCIVVIDSESDKEEGEENEERVVNEAREYIVITDSESDEEGERVIAQQDTPVQWRTVLQGTPKKTVHGFVSTVEENRVTMAQESRRVKPEADEATKALMADSTVVWKCLTCQTGEGLSQFCKFRKCNQGVGGLKFLELRHTNVMSLKIDELFLCEPCMEAMWLFLATRMRRLASLEIDCAHQLQVLPTMKLLQRCVRLSSGEFKVKMVLPLCLEEERWEEVVRKFGLSVDSRLTGQWMNYVPRETVMADVAMVGGNWDSKTWEEWERCRVGRESIWEQTEIRYNKAAMEHRSNHW